MIVRHESCGSTDISAATVVPRVMGILRWYRQPDGTVTPDEFDRERDVLFLEAEMDDPEGPYYCDTCGEYFNVDELQIEEGTPADGWEQRLKNALLEDFKV